MEKSEEIDRLSVLPDHLLCHILSFLPTKFSVRTSILSRRWRSIWTHVPSLDFRINDDKKLTTLLDMILNRDRLRQSFYSNMFDKDYRKRARFSNIVSRVMLMHNVEGLNTFRISYARYLRDPEFDIKLETWIRIAIARNVRNIDIRLLHQPPTCLFTCKTLVDLTLYCRVCKVFVSLPSLKRLRLCSVKFEVDEALQELISGCSMLEELIIENMFTTDRDSGCFKIFSPTVKRLTVNLGVDCSNNGCWVRVNAPALIFLRVCDYSYKRISFSPMDSLIEADIYLKNYTPKDGNYICTMVESVDCLYHVKWLKLVGCYYEEKLIDVAIAGSIVKFNNLTRLELEVAADWRFLVKLLESADNLEVLIVDINLISWEEPKQVPKCLLSRLKSIRIGPIVCEADEYNMVRYLVKNGKVLDKVELIFVHSSKAKVDAVHNILLYERRSEACKLSVSLE